MRKGLMVLLCLASTIASATDYYVSSSGNDSSNGLSTSTPWRTIAKVNSEFARMMPGDRILFNRGNAFYGTLMISRSGSSGSPITFEAYGSGANPVISAFTTISGWTSAGNGIYSKALSVESAPNIVTLDGVNVPIGRYPDKDWLSIDSYSGKISITDAALPASPDWDGAEIVIRKNNWVIDRNLITSHSGSTINYTSASGYSSIAGFGYFIQNHLRTLTTLGEWYYAGGTFYMYFGSVDPATKVVKVSCLNKTSHIQVKDYITFRNLTFEGANQSAFFISSSSNITIQDCNLLYSGSCTINGGINSGKTSAGLKILNNTINEVQNNAIFLEREFNGALISGNRISNVGMIPGMGGSGDGQSITINLYGSNHIVEYNSLTNLGFNGIDFAGNNIKVRNNLVNRWALIKDDAGGIYTSAYGQIYWTGTEISNNIILNGIGAPNGTVFTDERVAGIYLDHHNKDVLIQGNTVFNCNMGIFIKNGQEIKIYDNLLFANRENQLHANHTSEYPDSPLRNMDIRRNIMVSREPDIKVLDFNTYVNEEDLRKFGTADYNYYARPINDNNSINRTMRTTVNWYGASSNDGYRSVTEWSAWTGQDVNSRKSMVSITDVNKFRFEYNASTSNKVVTLDGSYIDVKGGKYSGSITLLPYTSAVLMVDPNPAPPPAAPVYVSSAIENGAPSIIELNYSLTLANIIPATSAFSVQVNSAARSVSSVSISGTKVLLTLSSPVAYGNTVTVAYTKPSTNPLQTSAGGQAANLTAQSVTNRVAAPPPPPAVPVFSGATVENAAPSVIVMTYNLALAAFIPAVSAFSVTVNSTARSISSVSVSGTIVSLTLSSPVVYGNTVMVAYTVPSSNPLQTSAGGKAVSIAAQAVSNRVNAVAPPPVVVTPPPVVVVPNTPPVAIVNYQAENYSGFTGVLNASGSYDTNKDNLSYSWKIPDNIPVSSTNTPVIEYLAPVIQKKQTYEFVLTVSDGKATQSKSIPVDILPYQPDLKTAEISSIEATDYNLTDVPSKAVDGNTSTMWSCKGAEQSLVLKLKSPFNIKHIMLAFHPGQTKESYFDIYCSTDGNNWDLVLAKAKSCSFSGNLQIFDFPDSKAENEYSFIKLVGLGNSIDNWNYISEFRIFGYPQKNPSDYEDLLVKIYPNPASELVNILIDEPGFNPDFIKIVSLTGKIMYSDKVDPGIRQFQVPVSLIQGVYIIQMGTGEITVFTQKLIVSR